MSDERTIPTVADRELYESLDWPVKLAFDACREAKHDLEDALISAAGLRFRCRVAIDALDREGITDAARARETGELCIKIAEERLVDARARYPDNLGIVERALHTLHDLGRKLTHAAGEPSAAA